MHTNTRVATSWPDTAVRSHLTAARAALSALPPNVDAALQHLLEGLQLLAAADMPGVEDAIRIAGALLARRQQQSHGQQETQPLQGQQRAARQVVHGQQEHRHEHDGSVDSSDTETMSQLAQLLARVSLHAEMHSPAGPQWGTPHTSAPHPDVQQVLTGHGPTMRADTSGAVLLSDSATAPILMETGREGLAQCALDDGSHIVCQACGGVVPAVRMQQHRQFWCQASMVAHHAAEQDWNAGTTAMSTSP